MCGDACILGCPANAIPHCSACVAPAVCKVCPSGGFSCAQARRVNGTCTTFYPPCGCRMGCDGDCGTGESCCGCGDHGVCTSTTCALGCPVRINDECKSSDSSSTTTEERTTAPASHAGFCPVFNGTSPVAGVCVACESDASCDEHFKCCNSACGVTCVRACIPFPCAAPLTPSGCWLETTVLPNGCPSCPHVVCPSTTSDSTTSSTASLTTAPLEHNGMCPPQEEVACFAPPTDSCHSDGDCADASQKCCRGPCGKMCRKACFIPPCANPGTPGPGCEIKMQFNGDCPSCPIIVCDHSTVSGTPHADPCARCPANTWCNTTACANSGSAECPIEKQCRKVCSSDADCGVRFPNCTAVSASSATSVCTKICPTVDLTTCPAPPPAGVQCFALPIFPGDCPRCPVFRCRNECNAGDTITRCGASCTCSNGFFNCPCTPSTTTPRCRPGAITISGDSPCLQHVCQSDGSQTPFNICPAQIVLVVADVGGATVPQIKDAVAQWAKSRGISVQIVSITQSADSSFFTIVVSLSQSTLKKRATSVTDDFKSFLAAQLGFTVNNFAVVSDAATQTTTAAVATSPALGAGVIVAIVVCCVVGVAAIVLLTIMFVRRSRKPHVVSADGVGDAGSQDDVNNKVQVASSPGGVPNTNSLDEEVVDFL